MTTDRHQEEEKEEEFHPRKGERFVSVQNLAAFQQWAEESMGKEALSLFSRTLKRRIHATMASQENRQKNTAAHQFRFIPEKEFFELERRMQALVDQINKTRDRGTTK
ncbi:MAG: hypothetical protein WC777_02600 [Candidatus Gracilibacteria bacterium]